MAFVAFEIAVWIGIAFFVGGLVGWFARGRRAIGTNSRRRR